MASGAPALSIQPTRSALIRGLWLQFAALTLIVVAACGGDNEDPTPTAAATQALTAAATPAASATPPGPTPRPAAAIEAGITKTFTDNRTFVPRATTDELKVTFDAASGLVTLSVRPLPTSKNSIGATSGFLGGGSNDALAITSQTALLAGRTIWKDYPEVKRFSVLVSNEFQLNSGAKVIETAAGVTVERATGEKMDYEALKTSVSSNAKEFFCLADGYRLHVVIWNGLADKGCLSGPSKGTAP